MGVEIVGAAAGAEPVLNDVETQVGGDQPAPTQATTPDTGAQTPDAATTATPEPSAALKAWAEATGLTADDAQAGLDMTLREFERVIASGQDMQRVPQAGESGPVAMPPAAAPTPSSTITEDQWNDIESEIGPVAKLLRAQQAAIEKMTGQAQPEAVEPFSRRATSEQYDGAAQYVAEHADKIGVRASQAQIRQILDSADAFRRARPAISPEAAVAAATQYVMSKQISTSKAEGAQKAQRADNAAKRRAASDLPVGRTGVPRAANPLQALQEAERRLEVEAASA